MTVGESPNQCTPSKVRIFISPVCGDESLLQVDVGSPQAYVSVIYKGVSVSYRLERL